MSPKILSTGILFLFLLGCAATRTTDTPSELMLEYRFQPDQQLAYDLSSQTKEVSNIMGQSIEVNTVSATNFTVFSKGMADNIYNVQITIDTSFLTITHPRGELKADMGGVIGKSFSMQLSPFGKEMGMKGNEEIQYTLGPVGKRNATTAFSAMFSDLSGKPAKFGDTWTTKDTIQESGGGMKVLIIMDGLSRLDGMTTKDGYECAIIVSSYKGTVQGEGTQGPMQMSTKGTLEGTDTTFFAYKKGVLLQSTSTIASKTTTDATGPQTMTIPGSRSSTMVLRLMGVK